jgi:aryl-alcohol dehydrogenase-like predicted oxidoreductase
MKASLGLGLAALGRPGYINLGHAGDLGGGTDVEAMRAHAHAVLDAAWANGVRHLDAARSYGRAEEFLASWLASRAIPPESVTVASKWGYVYTAGWQADAAVHEVKDHSRENLLRQHAESCALLGDHLDIYQVHSATIESGVLEDAGVLSELVRLREEGCGVGLSVSGPRQAETIRRALAVRVDGRPLFQVVQATWNLLERSAGPALTKAHAAGCRVVVKEALANGRLTDRNVAPEFAAQRQCLETQARRLGGTIDALALAAALAQPWAGVVLSGAASVAQLESNVRARTLAYDAEADAALADLAEPAEGYWSTRAGMAWN